MLGNMWPSAKWDRLYKCNENSEMAENLSSQSFQWGRERLALIKGEI